MTSAETPARAELPELELLPGEPAGEAAGRLLEECTRRGIDLASFEGINSGFPGARTAQFFQARVKGGETVILVMTGEWDNPELVRILDLLLKIQADPDPPGSKLRYRIYSAHPVPALLKTLFGDYRISALECRAAMGTQFGINLQPAECIRLAALGIHLLAFVGVRTGFRDPDGIHVLSEFLGREIHGLGLPPEGAPLNLLICLGCLYGELLRSRLPFGTDWGSVKECLPWPCLIVESRRGAGAADAVRTQRLGYNPIALVIQASQSGDNALLERSAASLSERAQREFGP